MAVKDKACCFFQNCGKKKMEIEGSRARLLQDRVSGTAARAPCGSDFRNIDSILGTWPEYWIARTTENREKGMKAVQVCQSPICCVVLESSYPE